MNYNAIVSCVMGFIVILVMVGFGMGYYGCICTGVRVCRGDIEVDTGEEGCILIGLGLSRNLLDMLLHVGVGE